jgi:hypothetical protein
MSEIRVELILDGESRIDVLPENFPMFLKNKKLSKNGRAIYDSKSTDITLAIEFIRNLAFEYKNINEATIWDFIDRDIQNNGELSFEQMKSLSDLKINYCWSII